MKQIFLASSLFELVCLAAGIDSGAYDQPAAPALLGTGGIVPGAGRRTFGVNADDADDADERILLVSNNAVVMELSTSFVEAPGAAALLSRFDRVADLNEALAPLHVHPSSWRPDHADIPIVEAYLRRAWDIGTDDVELVLESPQVNPAIALGRVFSRSTIRVHADGLMSFGPTRNQIPLTNGQRMSTLHYLPLVPGAEPRLLHEYGILHRPLSLEAFRTVVAELGRESSAAFGDGFSDELQATPWALIVGQYLSALGLISDEDEIELHVSMIEEAAKRGLKTVVFKPHPAAPPSQLEPLNEAADREGIRLQVLDSPLLAEVIIDRFRPDLIIGCFSTALMTAREVYGVPALAVGTDMLLEAITPYQNSNRIPLTIISELCDGEAPGGHSSDSTAEIASALKKLIDAVTFCMAPNLSHDLREPAGDFLERVYGSEQGQSFRRYFKRRRLNMLALPGGNARALAPRRWVKRSGSLILKAATRKRKRLVKRIRSR